MRIAVAMVAALGFGQAYAFHSGGVAECEGCHSMHTPDPDGNDLLIAGDQSSTCLSCHESAGDTGPNGYHVSTAVGDMGAEYATGTPLQRSPGGDFGWLKKSYSWVENGATVIETGASHGHNVVALDSGYTADTNNTTAPGGTFVAATLGCQSCHDPHGQARRHSDGSFVGTPVNGMDTLTGVNNALPIIGSGSYNNSVIPAATEAVGVYRILAGTGYSRAAGATFSSYPVAVAPSSYNRSEATSDTRVAYGGTLTNSWGDWCGTCHDDMHQPNAPNNYVHPTEDDLNGISAIYNAYIASGDLRGDGSVAYSSLVPFQQNTADFAALATNATMPGGNAAPTTGPTANDRVSCMSCHRAHASAFPHALRWQPGYEFITKAGEYIVPGINASGTRAGIQSRGRATVAQQQAGYYDRPATKFATYQRVLCNKCHGKD